MNIYIFMKFREEKKEKKYAYYKIYDL